jgi:hypothetical protein
MRVIIRSNYKVLVEYAPMNLVQVPVELVQVPMNLVQEETHSG